MTDRWPDDPHGWIYIKRAVTQLGQATFGKEWTDDVWKDRLPLLADKRPIVDLNHTTKTLAWILEDIRPDLAVELKWWPSVRQAILAALNEHRKKTYPPPLRSLNSPSYESGPREPNMRIRDLFTAGKSLDIHSLVSDKQWAEAVKIVNREGAIVASATEKFDEVTKTLKQKCEAGTIKSAVRRDDGIMFEIPRHHWNGDNLRKRFHDGCYHPKHPFPSLGMETAIKYPIFLEAVDFTSTTAEPTRSVKPDAAGQYDVIPQDHLNAPKREAARRALLRKYENGLVPKDASIAEINKDLPKYLRMIGSSAKSVSDDTVARVLRRK
jgi:hypothetical protein